MRFCWVAVGLVMLGCGNSKEAENPDRTARIDVVDASVPAVVVTSEPKDEGPKPPPPETASVVATSMGFTSDGTLVFSGGKTLVARAKDGTIRRIAIPADGVVQVSPELPGIAVDSSGTILLYATPSLKELFKGKGVPSTGIASAIVPEADHAVLLARGEVLVRFALPPKPVNAKVDSVTVLAGGKRINISLTPEDGDPNKLTSLLYDAEKGGTSIGRGLPITGFPIAASRAAYQGDVGYMLDGSRVTKVDLKTNAVLKQGSVKCPKGETLGNPKPTPSGDAILFTCGYTEGVVVDGATFAERRRIPKIMPGCDNGDVLDGTILSDNKTLFVEGCGGIAKLDISTGKYTCSDGGQLMGLPYDMGMGPGTGAAPKLPAGRANVPKCTPGDYTQSTALGHTNTYRTVHAEHLTITGPSTKIELEDDGDYPIASADETLFAYSRGNKIIVRSLPKGDVVAEVPLSAP